jgi:hypothetical protein
MQAVFALGRPAVRRGLIWALLVAAIGAAMYDYHATHHDYYAVASIAGPVDVTFIALLDARPGLKACTAANAQLLDPIARGCTDCRVLFAQCVDKATAVAIGLQAREAAHQYWVVSEGVVIAVVGVDARARATCEAVAADLARRGMRARCIHPGTMNQA